MERAAQVLIRDFLNNLYYTRSMNLIHVMDFTDRFAKGILPYLEDELQPNESTPRNPGDAFYEEVNQRLQAYSSDKEKYETSQQESPPP